MREHVSDGFESAPDDVVVKQVYARHVLLMWKYRAWRNARAHYRTADKLRFRAVLFMLAHAIAAIMVLGFASLDAFFKQYEDTWKLFVALAGLLAVLLAIVQLLLRYDTRAQQHKYAAGEFANLQRKLERYLGFPSYRMVALHNINREFNAITKNYPFVPRRIWERQDALEQEIEKSLRALEVKLDNMLIEDGERKLSPNGSPTFQDESTGDDGDTRAAPSGFESWRQDSSKA